ncbi:ATP-dependent RNA helicase ded-1, putative [Perkinsus marinus ATCC 50983]|uniref:RNA helicase n=1 Tax=Perkinsus marinus (strain ATCC 50983 / TXsc) TaxID=423536 RepID=C5KE40_PERM5|nr:ATP-dependent RNA helicase ded-1, putative [Perkinsus marinus ATCC 50983]EER17252.1 ATP-dependent RNA helicase ded-1, putative [Perkinsus marinus ATCC 50983]|eukprot:XP_002785456.1 ATP-dependent RNA helicase ded-1, putative [Perkinsus marinus ATCC 50983]
MNHVPSSNTTNNATAALNGSSTKNPQPSAAAKYVPPHKRRQMEAEAAAQVDTAPHHGTRHIEEAFGHSAFGRQTSSSSSSSRFGASRDSYSTFGGGKGRDRSHEGGFGGSSRFGAAPRDHERFGFGSKPSYGGHSRGANDRLDWSQPPPQGDGTWARRDGRRPPYEDERELFDQENAVHAGINFDQYDKIPVEVSGAGAAEISPLEQFNDGGEVAAAIVENIKRCGFDRPTPVQKYSIPTLTTRRDLMSCAQTGSGKTGAYLIPAIHNMLADGPPDATSSGDYGRRKAYPITLILSPTRELASQIHEEARKFCFNTGIRPVVVYGGADVRTQLRELERGCDILVATPGRLSDLMERFRVSLCQIKMLIFDEADRMLDMGFEPQIRRIVEQEDMPSSRDGRQSAMFSATFPREIQQLARDFLKDYIYLTVGRVGSTHGSIKQIMRYVDENSKLRDLYRVLEEQTEEGLTLVFVETKRKADEIENMLRRDRYPATSIHGDRSQWEREEALKAFKSGELPILVATDVAARGLDISHVNLVINYDLPNNIDDYVHRIGRTGRAGNLGTAIAFVNEGSKPILRDLWTLLEENKQEIPQWFMSLVQETTSASGRFGRGGGKGRGGGRSGGGFASRDVRQPTGRGDFQRYEHRSAGFLGRPGVAPPAPVVNTRAAGMHQKPAVRPQPARSVTPPEDSWADAW